MGAQIDATEGLALMHPVVSNVCVFTAAPEARPERQSQINAQIATALQLAGVAVFSTTRIGGLTALRAAITNHRTRSADIATALAAITQLRRAD